MCSCSISRITVSYAAGLIINTIHSPFNSHIDVVEPESFGKMDWHLRSGHDPCMLKPIPDSCCTFSRVMGFIRAGNRRVWVTRWTPTRTINTLQRQRVSAVANSWSRAKTQRDAAEWKRCSRWNVALFLVLIRAFEEKQHWHADRKKCTDSDKSGDIKCEDAPRKLSKPEVVLKRWTAAASPVQRGRPELTPQDPV